ncbi:MAG: hypothetical protein OEZ04_06850 [Nitrospinota bacterium]|nr:hypothetical protein [Nitrospinota bacterium]
MAAIDAFFHLMRGQGATELKLVSGQPPSLLINGRHEPIKFKAIEEAQLRSWVEEICPQENLREFDKTGNVTFDYSIHGFGVYQCGCQKDSGGLNVTIRESSNNMISAGAGAPFSVKTSEARKNGLILLAAAVAAAIIFIINS